MKKKLIVPAIAVALTGGAVFGATQIYAQTPIQTESTLVQRLAQRFNLQEGDVQKVFDEARTERHTLKKQKMQERFDTLVSQGKITTEQRDKIISKLDELHQNRPQTKEDFEKLAPDERRALMEKHKAEIETWAKENGIDPQYLKMEKMHKNMKYNDLFI